MALPSISDLTFLKSRSNMNRPPLAIGQRLPEGSVYAGINPFNGAPLFTMGYDFNAPGSWGEAIHRCSRAEKHGKNDWRLPSQDELNVLFENRLLIGGFNLTAAYWCSVPTYLHIHWCQWFDSGDQTTRNAHSQLCVRAVRGFNKPLSGQH